MSLVVTGGESMNSGQLLSDMWTFDFVNRAWAQIQVIVLCIA